MIYRCKRPRCRKVLLELIKKYDCTLQELLDHSRICLSHGLHVQAKKMIDESCFHSTKEIKNFEEKVRLYYSVGLI